MQTRNFGLRAVTLALAGVLTLGLAACEETKVVTPEGPTELTVSPQGPLDLGVGDVIKLESNVTNADAGATVTWKSSNDNVATVDANGQVTAVAPGTATVTASVPARGGGTRNVSVQIRVAGGGQGGDAAVVIEGVFDRNNDPVIPESVSGTVFLRLAVEKANADSLVVSASGQSLNAVVCRQSFDDAAAAQVDAAAALATLVCPINTAAYDTATFAAAFRNGPMQLTARLFQGGDVIATAATGSLTLANQDVVLISVAVENTDWPVTRAIDPRDNQLWVGGEVTVTGQPVIYSGTSIEGLRGSVGLQISDPSTTVRESVVAGANGRLQATFPEDLIPTEGGVLNVEGWAVPEVTNLSTAAGQVARLNPVYVNADFQAEEPLQVPGGQTIANYFWLDNRAPRDIALRTDVFEFGLPEAAAVSFVNADFAFEASNRRLFRQASVDSIGGMQNLDEGVDAVRYTFYAAPANTSNEDFLDVAKVVTAGRDLAPSETSTAYRLAVVVRDTLGNARTIFTAPGVTFGVDTVAPRIQFARGSVVDKAKFGLGFNNNRAPVAGDQWEVVVFDTTSAGGFTTTPVRAVVTGLDASGAFCPNGGTPTTDGTNVLPGKLVNGQCVPTADDVVTAIPTLSARNAYYTYTAYAVDQAGNKSDTVTRTIVVDDEDPIVRNIIFPSSFTAMQAANILGDVQDNLDLESFDVREIFPITGYDGQPVVIPFGPRQVIDPTFDANLVTEQRVTWDRPFVRSFSIFADAQGYSAPTFFRFRVADAAQNIGEREEAAPSFVQNPTAAQYTGAPTGMTEWSIAANPTAVTINGTPKTTRLTATLRGDPALANSPFANGRVAFYYYNGTTIEYIGEAAGVQTIRESNNNLRVTYTLDWTPTIPGRHAVFAVGITPEGDAVGVDREVEVLVNP